MKISVLASGSSGNSVFLESKESNILIDAGISAKKIKNYLAELGKDLKELDGVFVTHEHTDHVKGLEQLNKLKVPVYMNRETFLSSNLYLEDVNFFQKKEFNLKDLKIKPIAISHDAANPVGFSIKNNGSLHGHLTDLGKYNEEIKEIVNKADSLVLETNHDIDMVLNGNYPFHLKERIMGEKGHLSNIDAGLLVKENASSKLKNVFMAHISENNNTHELAMTTFKELTKELKLNRILTNAKKRTEVIKL